MSHASPNNYAQHAHSLSPCLNGSELTGSTTAKPGACNDDGADCLALTTTSCLQAGRLTMVPTVV